MPNRCKNRCGGTEARLFNQAYKELSKEMRINNLLMTLRAHTGVIKEKLELNDSEWKDACNKYKFYHVGEEIFPTDSIYTDSSLRSSAFSSVNE